MPKTVRPYLETARLAQNFEILLLVDVCVVCVYVYVYACECSFGAGKLSSRLASAQCVGINKKTGKK